MTNNNETNIKLETYKEVIKLFYSYSTSNIHVKDFLTRLKVLIDINIKYKLDLTFDLFGSNWNLIQVNNFVINTYNLQYIGRHTKLLQEFLTLYDYMNES